MDPKIIDFGCFLSFKMKIFWIQNDIIFEIGDAGIGMKSQISRSKKKSKNPAENKIKIHFRVEKEISKSSKKSQKSIEIDRKRNFEAGKEIEKSSSKEPKNRQKEAKKGQKQLKIDDFGPK